MIEIDKRSRIAELLNQGKKMKDVADEVGVSKETVRKYGMKMKNETPYQKNQHEAAVEKKVQKQVEAGYSRRRICTANRVSAEMVDYIDDQNIAKEKAAKSEAEKEKERLWLKDWLDKHWRFRKPRPKRTFNPVTGLRVVHKGERSNIRTPYRPDGIWR